MLLRNRIARAAAAAALVLALPLLSGCGMNFATDNVYTPAPGANDRDGQVDVLNAMIVSSQDGKGTLTVTVVNNQAIHGTDRGDVADQLTGVTGDVTATGFQATSIPAGGHVRFASEQNPSIQPDVDQSGIPVTGDFQVGDFVEIEFTFANADPVTTKVPVMPNNGPLEGEASGEPVPTLQERIDSMHEKYDVDQSGPEKESGAQESR